MKIRFFLIASVALFLTHSARAADSSVLTLKRYFDIVKANHPFAAKASLKTDEYKAYKLKARGSFDPKLGFQNEGKQYGGSEYFNLMSGSITVPTWYGIEVKTGIDRNSGKYLNPADNTPASGLLYAGLSVNLGKGLLIDERRAVLKQAELLRGLNESERLLMVNDLLLDAGKAYWEWYSAWQYRLVYRESVTVAEQRFMAVKQAAALGDRPAIDTLEAFIQLSERRISLNQAEMDYKNKSLMLSLFLWDENGRTLMPESGVSPAAWNEGGLTFESVTDVSAHPAIRGYKFKIDQLEVERKWNREQLKPELKLMYRPLSEVSNTPLQYHSGDYKYGIGFSMPLLLRKERGQLALTGLKLQALNLDATYKREELLAKIGTYSNEYLATSEQVALYTGTVNDYLKLLESERTIFNTGESSLFMINSRELSYIGARLKLIDLQVKNNKALIGVLHAGGRLWY